MLLGNSASILLCFAFALPIRTPIGWPIRSIGFQLLALSLYMTHASAVGAFLVGLSVVSVVICVGVIIPIGVAIVIPPPPTSVIGTTTCSMALLITDIAQSWKRHCCSC
jgi:hypothetical protein